MKRRTEQLSEKLDFSNDDEEDVQLAQEALDEYLANPSIGIAFDDFVAKEIKRIQKRPIVGK